MSQCSPILRCCSTIALLAIAVTIHADDIVTFSVDNRTPGNTMTGVTISSIKGDTIVFRTAGGEERTQPLKKIFKLTVAGDLAFTAAEDAYVGKQFDKAIDGYQKVARGADTWKIVWAVPRLMDSAEKTKRFDAALAGYIGLAKVDPDAASAIRPALPAKGSTFLDDAARDLDTAVRGAKSHPERQALLSLLLDVQLARGDQAGAEATVDQLLKLAGPNANDPKLASMVAGIRLGQARVAFEAKRWADVANAIDVAAPHLVEPKLQAEALYLRAESKSGLAKSDDRDGRLDAANAFMRVAAHFGDVEGKPFVAQSLLRAADLLASIGDVAEARLLCEQVNVEFANTPFSAQASERISRFSKPS